jgi:hypothetical protein
MQRIVRLPTVNLDKEVKVKKDHKINHEIQGNHMKWSPTSRCPESARSAPARASVTRRAAPAIRINCVDEHILGDIPWLDYSLAG